MRLLEITAVVARMPCCGLSGEPLFTKTKKMPLLSCSLCLFADALPDVCVYGSIVIKEYANRGVQKRSVFEDV